jgi:lipid-binding SYLF domain-containing protein
MKVFAKPATVAAMVLLGCTAALAQDRDRDSELDADELDGRRQEILQMADDTIDALSADKAAKTLIDDAYGYAVFDTTKGGFIVTGAGGTGVAMRSSGRDPVYMHMGAGGIGLGAGIENYKLVILFEDEATFEKFTDGEWSAGVSAQAAAGRDGAAAVGRFENGVAVYHLTDKGVIAQVDVTGVKFWPSDRLNPGVA